MVVQLLSTLSTGCCMTSKPPTLVHPFSSYNSISINTSNNNNINFTNNLNCFPSHSNSKLSFSVKCRQSDYFEQSTPRFSPSYSPIPSTPPLGSSSPRIFVGHSIYKGKAALTVEPRAPEFAPLDSGALKISKEGFVLLQFAPAAGVRQYDWSRKQVFSLSVPEIGSLISLGARESCEFFHDPNKGRSDEGKVRKVLKIEPLPDGFVVLGQPSLIDKRQFYQNYPLNLQFRHDSGVQNKLLNLDESIYIPITKAEFAILVSAFNFILPYLLGWHAYANSIKPEDSTRANNVKGAADYEWNR